MSILERVSIGNTVKINLELTKDRLNKDMIDAIKYSSIATILDFKITDGKGIGVVLKLSNGKEQWFFENEIDILDDYGNIIEKEIALNENINFLSSVLKNLDYENKTKVVDLLNPLNFINWLTVSIKDIF